MALTWKQIDDIKIRHVWVHPCDPDYVVAVNPDWYAAKGTPTSEEGIDLLYSHTEMLQ
jgi:hypothetical protein